MNRPQDINFVIVTSLLEEKQALQNCLGIEFEAIAKNRIHYNLGTVKHKKRAINVAIVQPIDMGPIPAAVIATKSIIEWQPVVIAMTGICAGKYYCLKLSLRPHSRNVQKWLYYTLSAINRPRSMGTAIYSINNR
ncbi:hypothetical protein [Synechococcus sp. ROS8604]|uniref:hypothetical protein n=1 Tax=Synechococcus sp. ROS8604 TaxID=1442557 RepID=UPI001644754E|nr:hypothetical protein [Synechococcus sp. ROS8604]